MRYVITGGPGVGKTTVIKELLDLGHMVVPESSRAVILSEQKKPNGILPTTNLYEFERLVAKRQKVLEDRVIGGPVFLDRSILDIIAYCRLGNVELPDELKGTRPTYTTIFLLDRLPNYANDGQRFENGAFAQQLHDTIATVYEEHGYSPIRVPVLTPYERAEFILGKIE